MAPPRLCWPGATGDQAVDLTAQWTRREAWRLADAASPPFPARGVRPACGARRDERGAGHPLPAMPGRGAMRTSP